MSGKPTPHSRPQELDDKAWLNHEYTVNRRTAKDIGLQFGITSSPVLRALKRHGIPRLDNRPRLVKQTSEIVRRYGEGESLAAIAQSLGATIGSVRAVLVQQEVPIRRCPPNKAVRQPKAASLLADHDSLRRLYVEKRMTLEEIANEFGCAPQTLRKALHRAAIEIRPAGGSERSVDARRRPTAARGLSKQHKRRLKERAGQCALCPATSELEVHHRDADRANDADENIVVLCRDCHCIVEWFIEPVERRLRGEAILSMTIPPARRTGWRQNPALCI